MGIEILKCAIVGLFYCLKSLQLLLICQEFAANDVLSQVYSLVERSQDISQAIYVGSSKALLLGGIHEGASRRHQQVNYQGCTNLQILKIQLLNMKPKILLALLSSLMLLQAHCNAKDTTCDAHIELLSDEAHVSFDKMVLEAYSTSGVKLEQSQCTPDGNCFIVIYNADEFVLKMKGPQGALFEPQEYGFGAGSKESCKGLSFSLLGFKLSLPVKARDQEDKLYDGPKGLSVELKRQSRPQAQPLATSVTDEKGEVSFDHITVPDTYELRVVSDSNLSFKTDSILCELRWESGFKCEEQQFLVTGVTLQGSVLSYTDPLPNVKLFLYTQDAVITEKGKDAFMVSQSDLEGIYRFKNVPPGSYKIVASYHENQSKFQVQPEVLRVSVTNKPVLLEHFHVIGFTTIGKVIDHKGVGVKGVQILIDGQQRATTNEKGVYKLDEITPGKYLLEGVTPHYFFNAMNVNLNAQSRQIPDLVATGYHLCGKILIENGGDKNPFPVSKRGIVLNERIKGGRVTQTSENGEFCFEVEPNTYTVKPIITPEEKSKGLKLLPKEIQVVVAAEPVLDLNFTQSKLSISGKIKCLEQEDQKCMTMKVQLLNKGKTVETEQVNESGQFKFSKVLPGKYLLKLQMEEFCWQQERYDIDVQDEDIKDINFIQSGYSMPYESTHTFDVKIKKGKATNLEKKRIVEGKNKLCLEQRGSYTITPDSCYIFSQEHFQFNTSASQKSPLSFKPLLYKVEGKVILKENDQASMIKMTALIKGVSESFDVLPLKKVNETFYSFEYFSQPDESIILEPRLQEGSNLLFYPKTKEFTIEDECVLDIKFEAKSGLIITGNVVPPTEGVNIKIKDQISGKEVANVTTDAKGQYRVGPLFDDQAYTTEAYKEDYIFKLEGNSTFIAQKLSSAIITVKDTQGNPLETVFLSLSSGKDFRATGLTNSRGQFKFIGLNKGKFYMTAILKEYEFDQGQVSLEVNDGEQIEKILRAKRIAQSAYGSVTQLNGLPLEHARVLAKCEDCERTEETVINQDGLFRIRGLLPGHKYQISVESNIIERTVPHTFTVEVGDQDSRGHEFLAIMQSPYTEVSGSVSFEGEDPALVFKEDPKAVVELYEASNLDQPIRSWQLSLSRYFQFSTLPRKDYVLKVVPKRGPTDKRYEPTFFKVNEQNSYQELYVPSVSKKKEHLKRTALIGPLLIVSLIFLYFYQEKVAEVFGSSQPVQLPRMTPERIQQKKQKLKKK